MLSVNSTYVLFLAVEAWLRREASHRIPPRGCTRATKLQIPGPRHFIPSRSIGYEVNRRGFPNGSHQCAGALEICTKGDSLAAHRIVSNDDPHVLPRKPGCGCVNRG